MNRSFGPYVPLLILTLALVVAVLVGTCRDVAAQQFVLADGDCSRPQILSELPTPGSTHASTRDSQGRCTSESRDRPWLDGPYGPIPKLPDLDAFPEYAGHRYLPDLVPGYAITETTDHLGLRVGYVAWNPYTHDHLYFNRYGELTHVLVHVALDQFAVYGTRFVALGFQYLGVVYSADPPRPRRWDMRLVTRYPFLYEIPR